MFAYSYSKAITNVLRWINATLPAKSLRFDWDGCRNRTMMKSHLKTFYFQAAFSDAPYSDPLSQRLRFYSWFLAL